MRARSRLPSALRVLALGAVVGIAGCGGDADPGAGTAADPQALPRPQQTSGAITDMPARPGPGEVPLTGEAPPPPPELLPADANFGLPPLEDNPETGLAEPSVAFDPSSPQAAQEPGPEDAVAVVRDYYAALAARDAARAYALWSDGGRSSGQSPEQFAAQVAALAALSAQVGAPGRIEGAAGSRFVLVPVGIAETLADGSVRKRVGQLTLRRAVVDGASAEQRAWRIAAIELRDAAP